MQTLIDDVYFVRQVERQPVERRARRATPPPHQQDIEVGGQHSQAVGAADSNITQLESDGGKRAFAISYGDNRASLFQTTTGGQRGAASTISLSRTSSTIQRVPAGSTIQIVGQLQGGKGGEQVRVAIRQVGQRAWKSAVVTVGANGGGSFTANFGQVKKAKYQVVAGWAGDSGRAGAMTKPKLVTVR